MYCTDGIKELFLLLIIGLGYMVLSTAKEEGGVFKKLGLAIGTFMIVFGCLLLVMGFLIKTKLLHKGYSCHSLTEQGFMKEQDPPILDLPSKK